MGYGMNPLKPAGDEEDKKGPVNPKTAAMQRRLKKMKMNDPTQDKKDKPEASSFGGRYV